jgi:hypothetical protein
MTLYTGSQQSVQPVSAYYNGDFYPGGATTTLAPVRGFIAAVDCPLGSFVWAITDNTVSPIKPLTAPFKLAGIVARTNNTPISFGQTLQGFASVIGAGLRADVVVDSAQEMVIAVVSLNVGSSVNYGDGIYVNDTTGVVACSTSAPGAGYTATGYTIVNANIPNPTNAVLVAISKSNNI